MRDDEITPEAKGKATAQSRWKLAAVLLATWIGLSIISKLFLLLLNESRPGASIIDSSTIVWSWATLTTGVVTAIRRRALKVFGFGVLAALACLIPIAGMIAGLVFFGWILVSGGRRPGRRDKVDETPSAEIPPVGGPMSEPIQGLSQVSGLGDTAAHSAVESREVGTEKSEEPSPGYTEQVAPSVGRALDGRANDSGLAASPGSLGGDGIHNSIRGRTGVPWGVILPGGAALLAIVVFVVLVLTEKIANPLDPVDMRFHHAESSALVTSSTPPVSQAVRLEYGVLSVSTDSKDRHQAKWGWRCSGLGATGESYWVRAKCVLYDRMRFEVAKSEACGFYRASKDPLDQYVGQSIKGTGLMSLEDARRVKGAYMYVMYSSSQSVCSEPFREGD